MNEIIGTKPRALRLFGSSTLILSISLNGDLSYIQFTVARHNEQILSSSSQVGTRRKELLLDTWISLWLDNPVVIRCADEGLAAVRVSTNVFCGVSKLSMAASAISKPTGARNAVVDRLIALGVDSMRQNRLLVLELRTHRPQAFQPLSVARILISPRIVPVVGAISEFSAGRVHNDFSALGVGMKVIEYIPVYCSNVFLENVEFVLGVDAVLEAVPFATGGFALRFIDRIGPAIFLPGLGWHFNSRLGC